MVTVGVLTGIGGTLDQFFPELCAHWRESGLQVVSAASNQSRLVGHTILPSVSRRPQLRNLAAPREIRRWVADSSVDVILTNTAVVSFLARIRPQPCPVVYFCHGLHWDTGHRVSEKVWQAMELAALKRTSGVIVINDDDEEWFTRHAPRLPRLRLPSGVGLDVNSFPRSPMPSGQHVRLLWAGEFSDRKRPLLAVEVLSRTRARGVDASLVMCGSGPLMHETQALVERENLTEHVQLAGQQADIASWIRKSNALLLTSRWEGLPRIGLEAIAVGRPVLAFDVKGTRSLDGVVLAPNADPDSLAGMIAAMLPSNEELPPVPVSLGSAWVADEIRAFVEPIAHARN